MKKLTKKEIKKSVTLALETTIAGLRVSSPSKKTRKVISKTSKLLALEINRDLKKEMKDIKSKLPAAIKKKTSASVKSKVKKAGKSAA
jgi:hypothetical protein